jgi:hypothetical protein
MGITQRQISSLVSQVGSLRRPSIIEARVKGSQLGSVGVDAPYPSDKGMM